MFEYSIIMFTYFDKIKNILDEKNVNYTIFNGIIICKYSVNTGNKQISIAFSQIEKNIAAICALKILHFDENYFYKYCSTFSQKNIEPDIYIEINTKSPCVILKMLYNFSVFGDVYIAKWIDYAQDILIQSVKKIYSDESVKNIVI